MATPAQFLHVTAKQDDALRELEKSPVVNAKVRLRASIIRLNNAGWSAPKLAKHLGRNLQSVHNNLNRFEQFGFEGLADGKAMGAKSKLDQRAHLDKKLRFKSGFLVQNCNFLHGCPRCSMNYNEMGKTGAVGSPLGKPLEARPGSSLPPSSPSCPTRVESCRTQVKVPLVTALALHPRSSAVARRFLRSRHDGFNHVEARRTQGSKECAPDPEAEKWVVWPRVMRGAGLSAALTDRGC